MFATPRTLEEMQLYGTAYAVNVHVEGDLVARLGFSEKSTKGNLLKHAAENGEFISSFLTEEELDEDWAYSSKTKKLSFGRNGRVTVSYGETERDARNAINT